MSIDKFYYASETSREGTTYVRFELAKDVRWTGNAANYHGIRIHRDDVEGFVARVKAWKTA